MRRVEIYKWTKVTNSVFEKIYDSEGIFIQYGVDYVEFESGPGNFTTAIVEMPDGSVRNISVDLIKFI